MGKAKKARASSKARHDPMGGSPAAAAGGATTSAPATAGARAGQQQQQKAHKLLEDLRSPDLTRKEAAVMAMAQLLAAGDRPEEGEEEGEEEEGMEGAAGNSSSSKKRSNSRFRALIHKLVGGGAVPLLMERMFDTSSTVKLHAAGALRYVDGGEGGREGGREGRNKNGHLILFCKNECERERVSQGCNKIFATLEASPRSRPDDIISTKIAETTHTPHTPPPSLPLSLQSPIYP